MIIDPPGNSKVKYVLWFTLLICPLAYGAGCPTGQPKDESTLVQLEPRGSSLAALRACRSGMACNSGGSRHTV